MPRCEVKVLRPIGAMVWRIVVASLFPVHERIAPRGALGIETEFGETRRILMTNLVVGITHSFLRKG